MTQDNEKIWNQRFVRRIVDSMADGVFILDSEGRIVSWNRSMERISGYTADEALGQTCALLACSSCFGMNCPADIAKCRIREKGYSGAKECRLQHKEGYDVPIIKHAGVVKDDHGRIEGIVETITDMTELNKARQQAEEAALKLGELHRLDNIIGRSPAMRDVFKAIRMAAASDATVLIQGESGTGKELIAGAIHFNSARKNNPMITVNCSALPESLLESELFGHIKGAFTGAVRPRIGRFEEADEGTVFLDEIGELSPFIQVKLLRVLQEKEIERVGESRRRKVDIRVVTATHSDLQALVGDGNFREDLYYRLNVFPIRVPPLRERREDIALLASHFIRRLNTRTGKSIVDTSREVMRIFMDYRWPGNVRELQNAVEHAFVLCNSDRIEREDLPLHLRHPVAVRAGTSLEPERKTGGRQHAGISREQLMRLLEKCGWNKAEVARALGVSHTAIWKYMKKWDIPLKRT
jgi:two-component system, NtrC family, response regulator HydG